ncbi:NAD(P)H:plastoquinone dehydrogenase complex subunit M [Klebsormidium nitens]|uniref:NAD(P)H-quinone oxidoreductase subunit M, chloroplastic n=1 Tax=Klebsormidium nitens TaxID=105231 RepID=A0A1Y1HX36_KLENI|nr:NAD(P)H:plastoquinone dehydrogenase complex subunit M [Klebsormidium nitens]|eukprot:GAQ80418.1 NAD(P)H:plastoquinone dehydrogenase complex subunit M [Klebsormidium nitens]
MAGGRWLSSTTRHVRIYIGYVDPETHEMDQQQSDLVTIDLDPDNEFLWPEEQQQKVFDFFDEQVENYKGAPMDEYTLRLIGSEIEHFIRKMLVAGEIKYNLECRVLNFSMGKPRIEGVGDEESQ